ncbi:hypothetical protein ACPPVW_15905 [Leifsonia sp. McL0607]|uniref:hypothetical protein n=1 Tax=Leifsonia sp. McL0607 TaxID=3415672 RepID=UPI003CE7D250
MTPAPGRRVDYSGMTTRRWLWPAFDLGVAVLDAAARLVRWHLANREARAGHHTGHTVCRHGRAVVLDQRDGLSP